MSHKDVTSDPEAPPPLPAPCPCTPLQPSHSHLRSCRRCGALLEASEGAAGHWVPYARSKLVESRTPDRIDPGLVFSRLKSNAIGTEIYDRHFPHSVKRKKILDALISICQQFSFTLATYYTAVDFVNHLASTKAFPIHNPKLTAQVCALLAAKANESEAALPSLNQYLFHARCELRRSEYVERELQVSNLLDFHFRRTTPYTVFVFLAEMGILRQRDLPSVHLTSPENHKRISEVESLCLLFLEMCSQHYYFFQFPPHVVATACIVQARNGLQMHPWPAELGSLTGLAIADMAKCLESMTCLYKESKADVMEKFGRFLRSISGNFGKMVQKGAQSPEDSSLESIGCKDDNFMTPRHKKIEKNRRPFSSMEATPALLRLKTPPEAHPKFDAVFSAPHIRMMGNPR